MSWSMCEAHFKKCHATDQTVIFSRTQKGVCVLWRGSGLFGAEAAGSWPANKKSQVG